MKIEMQEMRDEGWAGQYKTNNNNKVNNKDITLKQ